MTALETRTYSCTPTAEIPQAEDPAMEMKLWVFRHTIYGLPSDHKALGCDENARRIYGFGDQQRFETFVNGAFRSGAVQTSFERKGKRGAIRNIYAITPLVAEALFALGLVVREEAKETKGRSSPMKKSWRHFVQRAKERLGEDHPLSAILHEPSKPSELSKKDMAGEQQEQGDEDQKKEPVIEVSVIRQGSRPVTVGFTEDDLAQLAGYNLSSLEGSVKWIRQHAFSFSDHSLEKLGMTDAIAVAILEVYNFVRQRQRKDLISFDELFSNFKFYKEALRILEEYFEEFRKRGINADENNLLLLFQRVLEIKKNDSINR